MQRSINRRRIVKNASRRRKQRNKAPIEENLDSLPDGRNHLLAQETKGKGIVI